MEESLRVAIAWTLTPSFGPYLHQNSKGSQTLRPHREDVYPALAKDPSLFPFIAIVIQAKLCCSSNLALRTLST
jgi:hypothetical protein